MFYTTIVINKKECCAMLWAGQADPWAAALLPHLEAAGIALYAVHYCRASVYYS